MGLLGVRNRVASDDHHCSRDPNNNSDGDAHGSTTSCSCTYSAIDDKEDKGCHSSSSSHSHSNSSILQRLKGKMVNPPWLPFALTAGVVLLGIMVSFIDNPTPLLLQQQQKHVQMQGDGNAVGVVNVAFIGNSILYYNDFPRFFESLGHGRIRQNSCLHGSANLRTILIWGNGMYTIWKTGSARIRAPTTSTSDTTSTNDDDAVTARNQQYSNSYDPHLYDFGACTVPQLLFGYDEALQSKILNLGDLYYNTNDNDEAWANAVSLTDDFTTYIDGSNPCLRSPSYWNYLRTLYKQNGAASTHYDYDFVVMNDNTRSPARAESRQESLTVLKEVYLPWFQQKQNTIPVFLCTYGYNSPYRDMGGGLNDIPDFTFWTYEGYREYAALLAQYLPESQKPRIAPVGLAFLTIWEENYGVWQRLFHVDQLHPSPLGTFLQGLVVYHTLFGKLPSPDVALRPDSSVFWNTARRLQPANHRRLPFPSQEDATYLYNVALRVCRYRHYPKSFQKLYNTYHPRHKHNNNNNNNNEGGDYWIAAANYTPHDDLYKSDDLF